MRRFNTGYQDGNYNLPSGHVEDGELPKAAMMREAKEEIGVDVAEEDFEFAHASYRPKHDETGDRVDFFFCTKKWSGEIMNAEPKKCDDLKWTDPDDLPRNTTPHVRRIIEDISEGITYSEIDIDFLKNEGVYLLDQ
jgi:8-oxo-dGTP pyrophosphatase MutT (NUDIX family)